MYKKVSLIALPKQDLLRPPAAIPILAAICEQLEIDYTVDDFNLWLHRSVSADDWHNIDSNWEAVNPLNNRDQLYYRLFQTKLKEFVTKILSTTPDLIAISVFSFYSAYCVVELVTEIAKQAEHNSVDIVIGGYGIHSQVFDGQALSQYLLDQNLINYFISGEGEIAFKKLLTKEYNYPGINNSDSIQITELDQFPFPSYKKINPRDYNCIANPEIMVTSSRGCVRNCTFCDIATIWPKFRYRSGQRTADELYYYYKTYGVVNFEFSDSLINGSVKSFREMNRAILEYKKIDPDFKISYHGQYICRPVGIITEQDYAEMKSAGCDYLYVGIESFSTNVRHHMVKKFNNDDIDFHLRMCGRYGIKNNFLMLVGYPTETLDDHEQNLETVKKYQHYAQADIISMIVFGYTTSIQEGTPLFHMKDQLNIVPEFEDNPFFEAASIMPTNWISLDNPTLTLVERIRRWAELIELASELGYLMPRTQHYISRFITILENTKNKKTHYQLKEL